MNLRYETIDGVELQISHDPDGLLRWAADADTPAIRQRIEVLEAQNAIVILDMARDARANHTISRLSYTQIRQLVRGGRVGAAAAKLYQTAGYPITPPPSPAYR
jgi:hypothetical protein